MVLRKAFWSDVLLLKKYMVMLSLRCRPTVSVVLAVTPKLLLIMLPVFSTLMSKLVRRTELFPFP